MLLERGVPVTLGNISLVEVAERLQRTTGAAYNIWPSQVDFHRELAELVCRETAWSDLTNFQDVIDTALSEQVSWRELARRYANAYLERIGSQREFFTFIHFVAVALDEPSVANSLREGYDAYQRDNLAQFEGLALLYELEVAPPYSLQDLVAVLGALAEGFLIRSLIDPSSMHQTFDRPDLLDAPQGWTLFAAAFEMTLTSMFRPIGK